MTPCADFFSGLGGFSEGARRAGLRPVFAANHWSEAIEWHSRNHPEARHVCQDLQQLDMRLLPDLSSGVLLAGPACQGHSQNSQPSRKGRGGSHAPDASKAQERSFLQRSTAWSIVAAAEEARPRTIIVENVPDMLRWKQLPAWELALALSGYKLTKQVLRSREFGSCQDRERLVIVADLRRAVHITSPGLEPGRVGDAIDLDETRAHRWFRIEEKSDRMRTRMRRAQKDAGRQCLWNNVSESRGRPLGGLSPTLTTKSGSQLYLLDGDRCRILDSRELATIQGFPLDYQIPAQRGLAGHMIGNAIPVELAAEVCRQIPR